MRLDARRQLASLMLAVQVACSKPPAVPQQASTPGPAPSPPPNAAPATSAATNTSKPDSASPAVSTPLAPTPSRFPPPDITPPSARSAERDDGRWKPFDEGNERPLLYTTLIHPHETSRFITLTLVAVDLTRARLELMPGVDDVGKKQVPFTPGLVPPDARTKLLAAFNGGFMPQHGRWGMQLGETTLLPPRDPGCSIAVASAGRVEIRTHTALTTPPAQIRILRQTPPCLLEQGVIHPDLQAGRDRAWAGQTPGIVTRRRSAIALSEDGQTLFYAVGVEASPKLLALGLRAAGAHDGAQLDINWNWTRFFAFGLGSDGRPAITKALVEVQHTKRDYVEVPSRRDFFYLVTRD